MCRVHAHGDARASTARERVISALRTSSRPRGARLDGRTRGRPRRDGDGGALVGAATTMKSTMKSSSPLRPRARATAIALALAALCASFVPTARAEQLLRARGAPDAAGGARTTLSTPRASPPVAPRRLRRPRANGPISPAPGADGADAPPPPPPTRRRAAQISWLYPPKGHIIGGTVVTIYGSGFKRSATGKVREPRRESTSSSRGPSHPPSRS